MDSYLYLTVEFIKTDQGWKIQFYGIEGEALQKMAADMILENETKKIKLEKNEYDR